MSGSTQHLLHLTKALHTPKPLALLYEVNAMYRQIFVDGRPLPEDPTPAWNGYSTADCDEFWRKREVGR